MEHLMRPASAFSSHKLDPVSWGALGERAGSGAPPASQLERSGAERNRTGRSPVRVV